MDCPACEEFIKCHGRYVCDAQFCYRRGAMRWVSHCVNRRDGVGADSYDVRLFEPQENGRDVDKQLALWTPRHSSRTPWCTEARGPSVVLDEVPPFLSRPVRTQTQTSRQRSFTVSERPLPCPRACLEAQLARDCSKFPKYFPCKPRSIYSLRVLSNY